MLAATNEPLDFREVARLPALGDNVAIALRTFASGDRILIRQLVFEFAHTVLEGHRFAIHRIRTGEPLLSWGVPFGLATRDIEPGEYVCNEKILHAMRERSVNLDLPKTPNFLDHRLEYSLDETQFRPGTQVTSSKTNLTFEGFRRNEWRGAGTRNYIVVLGTSSRSAGFVRAVADQFKNAPREFLNVDGVVAVAHTEGGADSRGQNFDLTVRTLAGFCVNPNVAAVLCVDYQNETLSNAALKDYFAAHQYRTDGLIQEFFSISSAFESSLIRAQRIIHEWLPAVNRQAREPISLRYLKLGLQCGGSDAFSGISANPLVGILSRETVSAGGSANLAETDELIGAESYVLGNVKDLPTARNFLAKIDRFQQWAGLHGHSAEGNPSGGNMFRGLYNITIKSLGAARKKDPATRLDYVIDFAEPMPEPGFYFMDSPGNDLESIAGQVASGCNMILFATGNGSITNFPFVPTIKLMTTTGRFELVRKEMDFNVGRYLDGESMEQLGREAFAQLIRIASGERSAGERAGHSQVQLWREWRGRPVEDRLPATQHLGTVANIGANEGSHHRAQAVPVFAGGAPLNQVALVLPTSLCSGQIASLIAEKLNALPEKSFSRAVALPHTEGCGNSAGESETLFLRTMAGYLAHPLVGQAVLLEHGCEKTHNDAFRHALTELQIDPSRYGFASIQLDGGIERVTEKVLKRFTDASPLIGTEPVWFFSVALASAAPTEFERRVAKAVGEILAEQGIGTVYGESFEIEGKYLEYGERFVGNGICTMAMPTTDLVEMTTGLGASGAQLILVFNSDWLMPGNPLVPTVQVAASGKLSPELRRDVDFLYSEADKPDEVARKILRLCDEIRAGKKTRSMQLRNMGFQITRGYTGISL